MQKTKMIFTIGPASSTEEIVSKLIEAGMSVSRHNFLTDHIQNTKKE